MAHLHVQFTVEFDDNMNSIEHIEIAIRTVLGSNKLTVESEETSAGYIHYNWTKDLEITRV
jgi:hypothetical protein